MILDNCFIIPPGDRAQFAWSNLRRFHNVEYVEAQLCKLHALEKDHRQNAKKQARQIRYCLVQAKEYFDSADRVTLATRPTLLYYCAMSLALAEVLFKQSGDSSLDRARESHKHHGLTLSIERLPSSNMSLQEASARLRAKPLVQTAGRTGTFDLWHRSARELPIVGEFTQHYQLGSSTSGYRVLFGPSDVRLELVSEAGLSLYECFSHLPCMGSHLNISGIPSSIIRARARYDLFANGSRRTAIALHPSNAPTFQAFCNNLLFHPAAANVVDGNILDNAGTFTWTFEDGDRILHKMPAGTMWNCEEAHFWVSDQPLNEFGFFYVALYILGNYARYYPDRWMLDVEQGSALALAAEELLQGFSSRGPLQTLSELSRAYFVEPKA